MQSAAKIVNAYSAATWAAHVIGSRAAEPANVEEAWQVVHRKLERNASARAQLDADELDLLVEAERLRIWKPLGMVSLLDYMERVLGYGPETAQKRIRVARSLRELPVLREALRTGELSFSAVRELSRVATAATEADWRDDARGKNLRQIEQKVAQHQRGDLPTDPPDPQVRWYDVTWKLDGEAFAILRQTRRILDDEHGRHLEPSELVKAMGRAVIDRGQSGEHDGRATHQIALVVCERCKQGWQHGAGVAVPVDAAIVERAECNAQHVGSLHADAPARAHQDIPPSIVRLVWLRDQGRCQTPGCRSTRGLEIHHVVRRADGGTHDPSNLTLRCFSCHAAHHEGRLVISGTAPDRLRTERPVSTKLNVATTRSQARDALVSLGWKSGIATAAVDEALAHVATDAPLEAVIREALRRCPKPRA